MGLFRRISTYSPHDFVLRPSPQSRLAQLGRFLFLVVCVLATASLVFLSYPGQSHSIFAWVAWAPFFWGITKIRRFRSAFFYGWITAFLFNAGIFYWIYYTCLHGGNLSVSLSAAAWLGLSALLALQTGLFGGCCFFLKKLGFWFPLLAACGFVTLEWLHQILAFYFIGFPWVMWGYTQWNYPEILQVASCAGVYGVSFLLILVSALMGWALAYRRFFQGLAFIFLAITVWFGAHSWGKSRLPSPAEEASLPHFLAAIVQPNIDQYKKWDPLFEQEIADTIASFGTELEGQEVFLTVWPESVTPGEVTQEPYWEQMHGIADRTGSYQLVGSTVSRKEAQYVGAYLLMPNRETWQAYRKIKLVPFGEYIPLEKIIRGLFPQVEILGELGMFAPGPRVQPLLTAGEVKVGSTLCYEAIFPQLWRNQARKGAQVFANLTNDAWFFNTAAPHQHLAANVLRAVETGRPLLRAANTGISALIDPFGRIDQRTPLFTQVLAYVQVPLLQATPTFYTEYGNVWVWICAVLFVTALIFSMVFMYE